VNDPAIVADEPTGDLDSENAEEIVALTPRLNEERGLTFLIVTHDISAGRATDRIVRMVDGQGRRRRKGEVRAVVARVTLAEVDAVRMSIDSALEIFRESVLPALYGQEGYEGCFVLATGEGKALVMFILGGLAIVVGARRSCTTPTFCPARSSRRSGGAAGLRRF
jgi:energy-coupling factor transporter ATP-binding protein EcfA2